jgi:thioredoxin-like negative regulator of GroEL
MQFPARRLAAASKTDWITHGFTPMPDMTVPAVLFTLVLLILLGQWLVVRRAKSMQGQPVPDGLARACQYTEMAVDSDLPFEALAGMNVLVAFEAPNCSACRKMAPVLDAIAKRYPGRVCSLSVMEHRSLAQTLRIMGTPTMLLVGNGQIVEVFVGITPLSRLLERLQQSWPDIAPVDTSPVQ